MKKSCLNCDSSHNITLIIITLTEGTKIVRSLPENSGDNTPEDNVADQDHGKLNYSIYQYLSIYHRIIVYIAQRIIANI